MMPQRGGAESRRTRSDENCGGSVGVLYLVVCACGRYDSSTVAGRRLETQHPTEDGITNGLSKRIIGTGGNTMTYGHITGRLKRLALAGALAALIAVGAAGSGVAGDPSQWGVVAGDPSQWGQVAGDPSQWEASTDSNTALNFTKIEYQAFNFTKIEF